MGIALTVHNTPNGLVYVDDGQDFMEAFILSQLAESDSQRILSGDNLYGAYELWRQADGDKPLSDARFAAALARLFPNVQQAKWLENDGSWFWGIKGVRLTHAASTSDLVCVFSSLTNVWGDAN